MADPHREALVNVDETPITQRPKVRGRPFVRGQSGNPGGRPRGARNRTTLACEQLLDGEAVAVTRKAIAAAKRGDPVALRLVVERILPRGRGRSVEIGLPKLERAADIVEGCSIVIAAVACGDLTISEGEGIMRLLEVERRAIETSELSVRIELLEGRAK